MIDMIIGAGMVACGVYLILLGAFQYFGVDEKEAE